MLIVICGIDPALSNFGLARAHYDVETGEITPITVTLTHTEKSTAKTIRRNSDDLRRSSEQFAAVHKFIAGATVIFAEIPTGSQSARGSFSNGVCCGLLSSIGHLPITALQPRMIQVTPSEVKMGACGTKHATKQEMIDWAVAKAPDLPWLRARNKPTGAITAANEHLADALASIYAGVETDEFKNLMSVLRGLALSRIE